MTGAVTPIRANDHAQGHDKVVMRYGPIRVAYHAADPSVRLGIREPHARFRVPESECADLTLSWKFDDFGFGTPLPLHAAGSAWEARSLESGGEEIVFFETRERVPALRLELNAEFSRGEVTEAPLGRIIRVANVGRYPFDEFVVTRLLGRAGQLLLHASAVIVGGEAAIFVGHSGAGKSTISRLLEDAGATVLTDDRTILATEADRVYAWGTPWHGSGQRALAEGAAVRAMFLLNQAPANSVAPIPTGRAVKELFVRLIQPRVRAEEVGACLDTIAALTDRIPIQTLNFTRSTAAADFVLNLLAG